jgi:uncharacterized protein
MAELLAGNGKARQPVIGTSRKRTMTITAHALAIETFAPVLTTLSALLDKGAVHARAKGGDLSVLMAARLAPDMFPLSVQVKLACHHAKDAAARLTGATPPKRENEELRFDELKVLIEKTLSYLRGMSPKAFDGAEDRKIEITLQDNRVFQSNGLELLRDWSIPHFYFHVVTAYDILRHNGVAIGKRDYMNHVGRYIHQRADR